MRFAQFYIPTTAQELEHAEQVRFEVMQAVRDEAASGGVRLTQAMAEKLGRAAVLSYLSAMEETRH